MSMRSLIVNLLSNDFLFMGRLGFEPRTYRLKAEYSTVELATQMKFFCLSSTVSNLSTGSLKLQRNFSFFSKLLEFR